MKKNPKYLLCPMRVTKDVQSCLSEVPRRTGMYNWLFLFEGDIIPFHAVEDFTKYDIIQVNMSPIDMLNVPEIKKRIAGTNTKLVLNNDHVQEVWHKWDLLPQQYLAFQEMGDMVFGTELHQTSHLIDGAFCFPHPTQTKFLKSLKSYEKIDEYGVLNHWWHGDLWNPYVLARKLKEAHPKMVSNLLAWMPHADNTGGKTGRGKEVLFDKYTTGMNFPEYADLLLKLKLVYDPCPFHTYGRNGVDAACLRVPFMGSDRVFSNKYLFPDFVCDPYDVESLRKIFAKIVKGGPEIEKALDYAYEKVEYFNYENSKKRFLRALEMAENEENKKKKGVWKWNEAKEDFE